MVGERRAGALAGSRIPKVARTGKNFCTILIYFTIEMGQRGGKHC